MVNNLSMASGAGQVHCPMIRIPAIQSKTATVPIFVDNQPAIVHASTPIGVLVGNISNRKPMVGPPPLSFPQCSAEKPSACYKIYG